MSFVKIWVHTCWACKNRQALITEKIKTDITEHIRNNALSKGIYIKNINGYHNHLHCLFSLPFDMTISKAMNLIKGESSYWINKNNLIKGKFEWGDEYFAVSVSESSVNDVDEYISRQSEHHKVKTFQEEYDSFLKKFGFDKFVSG